MTKDKLKFAMVNVAVDGDKDARVVLEEIFENKGGYEQITLRDLLKIVQSADKVIAILIYPTLGNQRAYSSGELCIDLERMRVTSHGNNIQLTKREWSVLRVFVKHAGKIVSTRQLLQEAWGAEYGSETDYVRTYVTRLRRKLEPDLQNPRYIILERGLGYRLAERDDIRGHHHCAETVHTSATNDHKVGRK